MSLKINKPFTNEYKNKLLEQEPTQISKILNNLSKRENKRKIYKKKITYNSFYDTYFTKSQKKAVIQGLLSYERAFYINDTLKKAKKEFGNDYKIINMLKEIRNDLLSKNMYKNHSLKKGKSKRLILKSTAQGLFDIIETSAQNENINQVDIINYMFEVFVNILEYYKNNLYVINKYNFNIEYKAKLLTNSFFTIQNMPDINSVFEFYRDLMTMHEDVNESESYLQLVQIYYYEHINKSDFSKRQIYLCNNSIDKLKSFKIAMYFKYFVFPEYKNINFRSMLKHHFHKYYDELENTIS